MTEAEAALDAEAEAAEDVAGTGEEDFEAGMRQNAMERDAASMTTTRAISSTRSSPRCFAKEPVLRAPKPT